MKKLIYLIAICMIGISGCRNNQDSINTQINPGFQKYVLSYTTGEYLSKATTFELSLIESVNDSAQSGDILKEEIFKFNPKISGKTIWKDSRTVEFIPDNYLKSNTVYSVEINLAKLIDVEKEFAKIKYEIKTKEQGLALNDVKLQTYGNNAKIYQLNAIFNSADILNEADFDDIIEIDFDGKTASSKWTHSSDKLTHTFVIDSVQRKEKSQNLELNVNGKNIDIDYKESITKRIPGLNEFELLTYEVINGDDQYINLIFSDPLKANQSLTGLISFQLESPPDFIQDGNVLKVIPNSKLLGEKKLIINKAVQNVHSYKLASDIEIDLTFKSIKPEVKLIGEGNIVPAANGLILPFEAVNLNAVDLRIIQIYDNNVLFFLQQNNFDNNDELNRYGRLIVQEKINLKDKTKANISDWNTFKIDLANYIKVQKGAIYNVELRFKKEYSNYACASDDETEISDYEYQQDFEEDIEKFDQGGYYYSRYYPNGYRWNERDNPCSISYFNSARFPSRNIMASDFGLIVKGSSTNDYVAIVSDLISSEAASSVKVKYYNYQRQLIAEFETNSNGIVNSKLESTPYFAIAEKGDKISYLKLGNQNSLSMSNFDVSGSVIQKGIKGFIYGERGIWRPGDMIYLNFILEDEFKTLPNEHPVVFEFYNPKNQLLNRRIFNSSLNGFYTYITNTKQDALTGNYLLKVKVGGSIFTKTIKIETIKPNRLNANIDFNGDILKKSELNNALRINAKWLTGLPANKLKAKVNLELKPTKTTFDNYSQYHFDNVASNYSTSEKEVLSKDLNSEGYSDFMLNIASENAPGFLTANFTMRIFENSGDFSIIPQKITYSPYSNYVGSRLISKGNDNWYDIKEKHKLSIVSLDENGKPVANKNVKIKIYKLHWRWWWESYNDNVASYISRSSTVSVIDDIIRTNKDGKAEYEFKIPNNSWRDNGRYLVMVEDIYGGHKSSFTTYFSEWYGRIGGKGKNSTMLVFNSDKSEYNVGETAKINMPPTKSGKALISIEKANEIVDVFWADIDENKNTIEIPITEKMTPNVFIHISLIQAYNQTVNDNPIRLYGVIQIGVEDPSTHLNPEIKMPDKLEPESDFEVKISEKDGKEMTYTLAIVDEGLLNITAFKTPNPWESFYAKEALGIRTWDFYDFVIGAYGAKLEKAFAIGGGESEMDPSKNKANRFKPVVIFDGPYKLEKGSSKTHKFTMPNYIGQVRVMVVAGDVKKSAYGNAEKKVEVKKDLMMIASLPRVLGPKEKVMMPITILALNKNISNVKITAESNDLINIEGSKSINVNMKGLAEKVVEIPLNVSSATGIAKINLTAKSNGQKATYQIELDVRNPNKEYSIIHEEVLRKGESFSYSVEAFGIKGSNSAAFEVSSIPPIKLEKRLKFLIAYPHGCLEQTTSSVFPQLFLQDIAKIDANQAKEIQSNILASFEKLRHFQLESGGFSYWPGNNRVNHWATNYVGHYLITAQSKGYRTPSGMIDKWVQYQIGAANNWQREYESGSDLNQAYRLYLLALAGKADLGAMNRMRESNTLSPRSAYMLAGAYGLINQNVAANKIIDNIDQNYSYRNNYYDPTFGSTTRDMAMKTIILYQMGRKTISFKNIQKISKELSSEKWMSTQTTAFALMAVNEVFKNTNQSNLLSAIVKIDGENIDIESSKPIYKSDFELNLNQKRKIVVKNTGSETIFVSVTNSGKAIEGKEIAKEENLYMSIKYTDLNGSLLDISSLKQGTDFIAEVEIRNPGYLGNYGELFLSQIFPSACEILNSRLFGFGDQTTESKADYIDIRDDRVYTYFSLRKHQSVKFKVMLNATYKGKFYLPAVVCGSMYDKSVEAVVPGKWIEIKE